LVVIAPSPETVYYDLTFHSHTVNINIERARVAKVKATSLLTGVAEVNGIGITMVNGSYGVKINISQTLPKSVHIPHSIDGVP
jgi:hypothetical protein